MLNPQFVAGEHGLFGGHKSEDIRTFFLLISYLHTLFFRNIYECPANGPKHMSVAVNKWKYRLQYKNYFGGVTTVSRDQFKKINGFANMFYGWGGEDDDLNHRITKFNLTVNRTPAHMARFIMLKHDKVSTF